MKVASFRLIVFEKSEVRIDRIFFLEANYDAL